MPDTMCVIHGVPMRQFWKKDDPNHVGQSWFSHKLDAGTWCNGKAPKAGQTVSHAKTIEQYEKEPGTYAGRTPEYWDTRSKMIGLCGLANAMLSAGKFPQDISVPELAKLLQKIERTAKELQSDSDLPF